MIKSSLGDGLGILIKCKPIPLHNWLAFTSWYSIKKYLPDASVVIACESTSRIWGIFGWTYRVKIPLVFHNSEENIELTKIFPNAIERLCISPYVIAIREHDGCEMGPVSVQSNQVATFVDCETGCGGFVLSDWIDKISPPSAKLLYTEHMTINEHRAVGMWESCEQAFLTLQ